MQPFFDNEKMPSNRQELKQLMYFNLEQLDKFIGVGKELRIQISQMRKELKNGFEKVATAVTR